MESKLFNLVVLISICAASASKGTEFYFEVIQVEQRICNYITCNEPFGEKGCPEGTTYRPGEGLYGCCGECVRFRENEEKCTGSIQPTTQVQMKENAKNFDHFTPFNESRGLVSPKSSDYPNLSLGSNVADSLLCGYSTDCIEKDKEYICDWASTETSCLRQQFLYDTEVKENLGGVNAHQYEFRWRPDCLGNGDWAPKQCKGSDKDEKICVCVDPMGNTTFGKTYDIQEEMYEEMNCLCSRKRWEEEDSGKLSSIHCLRNGNFAPLQCDEGWCWCVNSTTGDATGSQLPQKMARYLPCYNSTNYGEQYLRRCESVLNAHSYIADISGEHGISDMLDKSLNCDYDGSYAPLQNRATGNNIYDCVNRYNTQSETSSFKLCNCMRDRFNLQEEGSSASFQCDTSSGGYAPKQIRNDLVYCVDADGIRSGPLMHGSCQEKMDCGAAKTCQELGDNCEKVCENCPAKAYRYNDDYDENTNCS